MLEINFFSTKIPDFLKPIFWDVEFDLLDFQIQKDFIIGRILNHGSWEAISWLRNSISDPMLRKWFLDHKGAKLTPPQLRFWENVLELPRDQVDEWINKYSKSIWERRSS